MAMRIYRVSIPIQSAIHQSVATRISRELADGLEVQGWLKVRSAGDKTFLDVEVTARNREDAVGTALSRVDDFLYLLTLYKDHPYEAVAFDIRAEPIRDVQAVPIQKVDGGKIHVEIVETVEVSEKTAVHKRLEDISAVSSAFIALRRVADERLKRALAWYHLAACSSDEGNAFLGKFIAFEIMISAISRDLDPGQVEAKLKRVGIQVSQSDIRTVKRVRNRLVHQGELHEDFARCAALLDDITKQYLIQYVSAITEKMDLN